MLDEISEVLEKITKAAILQKLRYILWNLLAGKALPLVSSDQARTAAREGNRVSHVLYSCNSLPATCLLLVVVQV